MIYTKTIVRHLLTWAVIGFTVVRGAETGKLPATGLNLERDSGGWLNFAFPDNHFVVSFYDTQRQRVPAQLDHGLVRYLRFTAGDGRDALYKSADGFTLISAHDLQGPADFRIYLALFDKGPDDLTETYTFFYSKKWRLPAEKNRHD